MLTLNHNFQKMKENYLFAEVAARVRQYSAAHPEEKILRLGIGDVTLPLAPAAVEALKAGAEELGNKETFHGYPDYEGYLFLREAISRYYQGFHVKVLPEEIFVSDGAKSDIGNITDLFDPDNNVLIPDPVYPVYVDSNLMDGRKILYAPATEENGFLPMPDDTVQADLIYLCSPNNPTGACYSKEQLTKWVDYARKNHAIILFDAAYEAFITSPELPRSIFSIEGARECAIEFCSLSKTAGFTGTRCGYTVIPKELKADGVSLHSLWYRRQATKFNGVSYPVQCAAAAVFTPIGMEQTRNNIRYYQNNAKVMADALTRLGISFTGGIHSPYLWLKCPGGMGSWEFFDLLLNKIAVVGTPGEGFGENGKGWFRLTAFGEAETTKEAMARLESLLR